MRTGDVIALDGGRKGYEIRAIVIGDAESQPEYSPNPVVHAVFELGMWPERPPYEFTTYAPGYLDDLEIVSDRRQKAVMRFLDGKRKFRFRHLRTFPEKQMRYFLERQPRMGWMWMFLSVNLPSLKGGASFRLIRSRDQVEGS